MSARQVIPDDCLEVLKLPAVQCPINGWMLARDCTADGRYGKECIFYGGERVITDLAGKDYSAVVCASHGLRHVNFKKLTELVKEMKK